MHVVSHRHEQGQGGQWLPFFSVKKEIPDRACDRALRPFLPRFAGNFGFILYLRRASMQPIRLSRTLIVCCAVVFAAICQTAVAGTLCVNPAGSHNCFSSIQAAVNHASANDLIKVEAGTYKEEVDIGIPVAIIGAGASASIIDAIGLAHGIFVDGFDHPGLRQVIITGLTVENALFEGVLVVSASDITIQDNNIINNDTTPGLIFTGALSGCPGQPGNGVYETDETGDCGGALHLVGTANSIVSGNLITGNADGVLISDETAESHDNLKRLLAYSSIAHVGYMLLGLIASDGQTNSTGIMAIMIYLLVYTFMNLGAFAVITSLRRRNIIGDTVDDIAGLYFKAPTEAILMLIFLLSLAGIPPLAGFWGKYFIFLSLIETGHYTLAAIAVLYAVISMYYYMRIANSMLMRQPIYAAPVHTRPAMRLALTITAAGTVGIGLFPNFFINVANWSLGLVEGTQHMARMLR